MTRLEEVPSLALGWRYVVRQHAVPQELRRHNASGRKH